jgi:hypothetical protein
MDRLATGAGRGARYARELVNQRAPLSGESERVASMGDPASSESGPVSRRPLSGAMRFAHVSARNQKARENSEVRFLGPIGRAQYGHEQGRICAIGAHS